MAMNNSWISFEEGEASGAPGSNSNSTSVHNASAAFGASGASERANPASNVNGLFGFQYAPDSTSDASNSLTRGSSSASTRSLPRPPTGMQLPAAGNSAAPAPSAFFPAFMTAPTAPASYSNTSPAGPAVAASNPFAGLGAMGGKPTPSVDPFSDLLGKPASRRPPPMGASRISGSGTILTSNSSAPGSAPTGTALPMPARMAPPVPLSAAGCMVSALPVPMAARAAPPPPPTAMARSSTPVAAGIFPSFYLSSPAVSGSSLGSSIAPPPPTRCAPPPQAMQAADLDQLAQLSLGQAAGSGLGTAAPMDDSLEALFGGPPTASTIQARHSSTPYQPSAVAADHGAVSSLPTYEDSLAMPSASSPSPPPPPPPPSYDEALSMSPQQLQPASQSLQHDLPGFGHGMGPGTGGSASPSLPPAYDEALDLPLARPPPPSYEEMVVPTHSPSPPPLPFPPFHIKAAMQLTASAPLDQAAQQRQPPAPDSGASSNPFTAGSMFSPLSSGMASAGSQRAPSPPQPQKPMQSAWMAFDDGGVLSSTLGTVPVPAPARAAPPPPPSPGGLPADVTATPPSLRSPSPHPMGPSAAASTPRGSPLDAGGGSPQPLGPAPGWEVDEAAEAARLASEEPALPQHVCMDVRLPQLVPKPKEAPPAKRMAAGHGCLLAAPEHAGAPMIQWSIDWASAQFSAPKAGQRSPEDDDSAPAGLVAAPGTVELASVRCIHVDVGGSCLWTGHSDGRVAHWSLSPEGDTIAMYEHSWPAHSLGKVSGLAVTPWGELWSCSTSGSVRAWSTPASAHATGGRPYARLFECKRARVAAAGSRLSGGKPHGNARVLAVSATGRVVWSAGKSGLVIWNAYSGDFLGSVEPSQPWTPLEPDSDDMLRINSDMGIDKLLATQPFLPRVPPKDEDDEGAGDLGITVLKGVSAAAKFAAKLGKKIKQNVGATLVGAPEPGREMTEAQATGGRGNIKVLAACPDGTMAVAYKKGLLERYTEGGKLLWSEQAGPGTLSMACVGAHLWLGCSDCMIRVVDLGSGRVLRAWRAHLFPVAGLAARDGVVFSLAKSGAIRAWPAAPPTDMHKAAWRDGLLPCLRRFTLRTLITTWNVGEVKPDVSSLRTWLGAAGAAHADLVMVALQETVMSAGTVALDAAWSTFAKGQLEKGNEIARAWANDLGIVLGQNFTRVALRQLAGMLLLVFVKREHADYIGEVSTASVACGVMGVGGNKGAVAACMSIYRRRAVFVCSHFAAHQEKVEERNADYAKIVRNLRFGDSGVASQSGRAAAPMLHAGSAPSLAAMGSLTPTGRDTPTFQDFQMMHVHEPSGDRLEAAAAELRTMTVTDVGALSRNYGAGVTEAELLFWAGDFNYRINGSYEEVVEAAHAMRLTELWQMDQACQEMRKGHIFRGLREPIPSGHPLFKPTYKFDKPKKLNSEASGLHDASTGSAHACSAHAGVHNLMMPSVGQAGAALGYDSSEKRRVPAWTDRVFYRGSRPGSTDIAQEAVVVSVPSPQCYNAVMEVTDSDHKPVYAQLDVTVPSYTQEQKRGHGLRVLAAISKSFHPPTPLQMQAASPLVRLAPGQIAPLDVRYSAGACTTPLLLRVLGVSLSGAEARQQQLQYLSSFGSGMAAAFAGPGSSTMLLGRSHTLTGSSHSGARQTVASLPGWLEVTPMTLLLSDPSEQGYARLMVRAQAGAGVQAKATLLIALQPLWADGYGSVGMSQACGALEVPIELVRR